MSVRISVDPNWRAHVASNLHDLLDKLGEEIVEDAKRVVPVKTGHLRDSLDHEVDGDTLYVFSDVEYAQYVELGTEHMKAQPYLKPAVFKNRAVGEAQ